MLSRKCKPLALFCAFALLLLSLSLFHPLAEAPSMPSSAAVDLRRVPYLYSVDDITNRAGFSGSMIHIYEDFVFPTDGTLTMSGWVATDEGIHHYEYAWVLSDHRVPIWQEASRQTISNRDDLAAAQIPYRAGHSTAGFSIDILPPENTEDGYYDLYVRAVTGDGVNCDLALFSHMMYGTPDYDDGEKRIISFTRLAKTNGALTNATVTEQGLTMDHSSIVALGSLDLGAFERVRITYSLSQSYQAQRKSLIGFKTSPEHPYGDGTTPYDLTDHLVALPLSTETSEPQIAELDVNKVALSAHEALYLSASVMDGVTLTIHEIELTYYGQDYDRTAAKIYFSSDVISHFTNINCITLSGITDPIMGDVLRFEVDQETPDPYIHFHARNLLDQYDLRLTADTYKYMVVLARANPANTTPNMTFYLCAGTIYGATEDCTYTHTLHTDGQWHYYVFDLTSKENWKGAINGWRFDIISGSCLPGDYVDFASIQFFNTPEAATAAANASVTQNVIPHALGMPAVIRDDSEEIMMSDDPMTFAEGDYFVETTEQETEPPFETLPETSPDASDLTESPTDAATEEEPLPETSASEPQMHGGCSSAVVLPHSAVSMSAVMIVFCLVGALLIKKKDRTKFKNPYAE